MSIFRRIFRGSAESLVLPVKGEPPLPRKETPRIPTVKFDPDRVTPTVEADVKKALQGIPEISPKIFTSAYEVTIRSIRVGRDLGLMTKALVELDIPRHRAAEIARHVHDRATSLMDRERQIALGIVEAIWSYSGAPCAEVLTPGATTQDAEHRAADGRRYDIAKGLLVRGRRIWPGQASGCKCTAKSVIAGFDY